VLAFLPSLMPSLQHRCLQKRAIHFFPSFSEKTRQSQSAPTQIVAVKSSFTIARIQLLRHHQSRSPGSVRLEPDSSFLTQELTPDRTIRWLKDPQATSTTRSTTDELGNEQHRRHFVILSGSKNSRRNENNKIGDWSNEPKR
jgi:hypothetical protein